MSELPEKIVEILTIIPFNSFDVYSADPPVYPSMFFSNKEERDTYNKMALIGGYINAVKLEDDEIIYHEAARVICCGKRAYDALKNRYKGGCK